MSDREESSNVIRNLTTDRRKDKSDMDERMAARLQDDTSAVENCQAETRSDDPCSNNPVEGSQYCSKHQPNEYGELTWRFERKQWFLNPELMDEIFADVRGCGSLYDTVQENVGNVSKKSFENTAAQFIVEHSDEFLEFATEKYDTDE